MNAEKYFRLLREVKDVSFATVDEAGRPRVRIIDVMFVEGERLYFCTARGKDFYRQLRKDGYVAVAGMNQSYQTVRLAGRVKRLEEQKMWIDRIFRENPGMNSVYPGESRYILEAFCLEEGEGEFFDLGREPIVRESFGFGGIPAGCKGYFITEACIRCGRCVNCCPQKCIRDFTIGQEHCLHCGLCQEGCPAEAIVRRENHDA